MISSYLGALKPSLIKVVITNFLRENHRGEVVTKITANFSVPAMTCLYGSDTRVFCENHSCVIVAVGASSRVGCEWEEESQ